MGLQTWGARGFFPCRSQTYTFNLNWSFLGSRSSDCHEIWSVHCPQWAVTNRHFWLNFVASDSCGLLRSVRLVNLRFRHSHTFWPAVFYQTKPQKVCLQFLKAQCFGYRTSAISSKSIEHFFLYSNLNWELWKFTAVSWTVFSGETILSEQKSAIFDSVDLSWALRIERYI